MKKNFNYCNSAYMPIAKVGNFEVAVGREFALGLLQIINLQQTALAEERKMRSLFQAKINELEIEERKLKLEREKFEFELLKEERRYQRNKQ